MKNPVISLLIPLVTVGLLTSCFSARESGSAKGESSKRMEFFKEGLTLDANYDPRLDNLIPGYKILTVAVTNQGTDVLRLNPLKDRWELTDAYGKTRKAITSLRIKDPGLFTRLPSKVQTLIDYPVGISVGYSETIDLFFHQDVDLRSFRSVSFYNADRKQTYDALNNLESPSHVPAEGASLGEGDPRFAPKAKGQP